jgi:hypothetical protein
MNPLNNIKQKIDNLNIELGILNSKKKELIPILSQYKCKTPSDIKTVVKKLKTELKQRNDKISKLIDKAETLQENIQDALDNE